MEPFRQCAAVILTDDRGRVLLLWQPRQSYGLPGGVVEPYETPPALGLVTLLVSSKEMCYCFCMPSKIFAKPLSSKRASYEFGKYISENAEVGTVNDALRELAIDLEGTSFTVPKKSQASKLRKTYEFYILKLGFSIDQLENISPLDLYRAQTRMYNIVKVRADAERLIDRLSKGEDFTKICKENDVAPKSPQEYVIEKLLSYVASSNTNGKLNQTKVLVSEYYDLIRLERGNASEADRLFLEFNKKLVDLTALKTEEK